MPVNMPALVILAGGSSSRLWPLRDKSLLTFKDKTLLEHQLDVYINLGLTNIAIVANPDNKADIGKLLEGIGSRVTTSLFVQEEPKGMGDALLTLRPLLDGASDSLPVYICQVHDVFDPALHKAMLDQFKTDPAAARLASYEVEEYFPGGYVEVDGDLRISNIIEKPGAGNEPSNLVNIVAHVHPDLRLLLDTIAQEYAKDIPSDDHYERAMAQLMSQITFKAVPYSGPWHPVKFPWHVLEVMHYFLEGIEHYVADDVKIGEDVNIAGPVHIESGVRLFHGADIVGPAYIGKNCIVGQFTHIRHAMILDNCIAGLTSEVNRSYVGHGAWMHSAKALDSVLASSDEGKHINLSAGMITANLRGDFGNVWSTVKDNRLDTGRDKLGAIIGSGAFIGIGAMLMPGVKIGENSFVGPATILHEDVPDNTLYYAKQEYVKKSL